MGVSRRERARTGLTFEGLASSRPSIVAPSGTGRRANVDVRIDALVLEGVSARDRVDVGASVEHGLRACFAADGVPSALQRDASYRTLDAALPADATTVRATDRGVSIARAVYRSLVDARSSR
jgi:hypothetical protein